MSFVEAMVPALLVILLIIRFRTLWLRLMGTKPKVDGEILDGFHVSLPVPTGISGRSFPVIEVTEPSRLPPRLDFGPEDDGSSRHRAFLGEDVQVGDPGFDGAVQIRGDPVLIAALMSAQTRRGVQRLVALGVRMSNGALTVPCVQAEVNVFPVVPFSLIHQTVVLAPRLCYPQSLARALADNACSDPLPAVRLNNLQHLLESFSNRPETVDVCRTLSTDTDATVRLTAARALGDEGRETLVGLATDPEVDAHVASLAVSTLGPHLPGRAAIEALDRALERHQPELAGAAIAVLGQLGDDEAVSRLIRTLDHSDRAVAALAARALGSTTSDAAKASLVAALASEDAGLRVAAAESLGRCAGVEAVTALHATAEGHPLDDSLRRAVMGATWAIKERAADIAPGRLSLADGTIGAVSLSDNETGTVALTDEARKVESASRSVQRAGPSRSAEIDHAAPLADSRGKLRE